MVPADLLADFHRQAAVATAKHLLHQQQHRQLRREQGGGIKQQAVAGGDINRQQRGAEFARQFDKAGVPLFIADPGARGAGDLPRREEDQHPTILQLLLHQGERRFPCPSAHVIHRNKQRTQRRQMRQHAVGHHFHVPAHAGEGIQQRQSVQRTGGVIRDNNQRAVGGDLFEVVSRKGTEDIKMLQNLFHHIEPFQVTVVGGKLLKFRFV